MASEILLKARVQNYRRQGRRRGCVWKRSFESVCLNIWSQNSKWKVFHLFHLFCYGIKTPPAHPPKKKQTRKTTKKTTNNKQKKQQTKQNNKNNNNNKDLCLQCRFMCGKKKSMSPIVNGVASKKV